MRGIWREGEKEKRGRGGKEEDGGRTEPLIGGDSCVCRYISFKK